MTPQEALQLLDQAVAQMNTNRETHSRLVEAVDTLGKAIQPQQKPQEGGNAGNGDN